MHACGKPAFFLLQLDANLIEEEPYNRLTQKINLNHKITTSANYTDGIGTGYTSHNKEKSLPGKRLKNNFKINQSD